MQIAFLIYEYFPHGGRQRQLLSFVQELVARGQGCRIYAMSWRGPPIDGTEVRLLPVRGLRAHGREQRFQRAVQRDLADDPVALVVGFHKMPGLDIYVAADSCYLDTVLRERSALYRRTARYAHYLHCERSVFAPPSHTQVLLGSARARQLFTQYYGTESARMHQLPPGISRDCRPGADAPARRDSMRKALLLDRRELALLFVANSFRDKGLERVLRAQANMRAEQPNVETRLLVVGGDKPGRYRRLARRLGIVDAVDFLGPRQDVQDLLLAADVLVHPAVSDASGSVPLEALAAGLPVLASSACGYAEHIVSAGAGIVLRDPFSQREFNEVLLRFIDGVYRAQCSERALNYSQRIDLYSLPSRATDFILGALRAKLATYG